MRSDGTGSCSAGVKCEVFEDMQLHYGQALDDAPVYNC